MLSNTNKIISGLWISGDGAPLSDMERLCIHSFCANRHDFHLYVYGQLPNIPNPDPKKGGKVEVHDANKILPEKRIFTYHGGSYAGFADWFRWELMRKKGGWYVDMDIVCLRPFDFSDEVVFGRESINLFNSNIIKFPVRHFLPELMVKACANPNWTTPWDEKLRIRRKITRQIRFWRDPHVNQGWGESGGPKGFTQALKYFGMTDISKRPHVFSPIHFDLIEYMIDETYHDQEKLNPLLNNSYAIHWFNNYWSKMCWDKNSTYPHHSLYEVLKRRYLPEYR